MAMASSDATVATVYAEALVEFGQEHDQLDQLCEELEAVIEAMTSDEEIFTFLCTPNIGESEKQNVVDKAFKGKVSDALYHFLRMIVRRKREAVLPGIWTAFLEKYREVKKLLVAKVYTPRKLVKAQRLAIVDNLSERYQRSVSLEEHTRDALIGGIVVETSHEVLEFSIKSRLDLMGEQLRQTKLSGGAGYED